jgi:hypothetical protein
VGVPTEQNCILCGGPAEYRLADCSNRKHFWCLQCVEYQVSVAAERRVAGAPREWKQACSDLAKSLGADSVLVITVGNVDEKEGAARYALYAQRTPRAELPKPE